MKISEPTFANANVASSRVGNLSGKQPLRLKRSWSLVYDNPNRANERTDDYNSVERTG